MAIPIPTLQSGELDNLFHESVNSQGPDKIRILEGRRANLDDSLGKSTGEEDDGDDGALHPWWSHRVGHLVG